ncbi:VOC family protein [Cellulomonas aerilata]|uniref:VOC domain-containing protein n=1 Tax=Cellulomonas aerilata TaxID=515326 RepID=A0A512D7D6_9CELL|nr:VOC family protein [Cellulomonas aerilata]GEO32394.1 hypothetical protein CAE01nite_01190 [Cellulomonas aerilata]
MVGEPAFVEIGVDDAERARVFYGEPFGWRSTPGPSGSGLLVERGTLTGGIHGGDPRAAPSVFFRVDDLGAAVDEVRALGGSTQSLADEGAADADAATDAATMETVRGRFVLCRDDQGSPFGLFEPPVGGAGG